MKTSLFSKHIFWSYKPDADLPDNLIIKQVSTYGELEDLYLLCKLFPKKKIIEITKNLTANPKRVNFLIKILL